MRDSGGLQGEHEGWKVYSCLWDHAPLLGPGCWGEKGMGRRIEFPHHTKGTGTHSSECSEVVLSLLLQLDLLLQPVRQRREARGVWRKISPSVVMSL